MEPVDSKFGAVVVLVAVGTAVVSLVLLGMAGRATVRSLKATRRAEEAADEAVQLARSVGQ